MAALAISLGVPVAVGLPVPPGDDVPGVPGVPVPGVPEPDGLDGDDGELGLPEPDAGPDALIGLEGEEGLEGELGLPSPPGLPGLPGLDGADGAPSPGPIGGEGVPCGGRRSGPPAGACGADGAGAVDAGDVWVSRRNDPSLGGGVADGAGASGFGGATGGTALVGTVHVLKAGT